MHIAGIDLPKQLYDAAKNDALVIFVGAGVSLPSNIPNFVGLTDEILKGATNSYSESLSCSEKLERAELDGINIRRETKRIINAKNTGPATPHHRITDFFRDKTMRLVTTNFDLNLTDSAKKKKITHKSYYQPALPTGDLFDGIVYLHGAVSEDENTLIITEKDFARAYLKYGRQTAFIRELFSKFTVLFIGYSYDDKIFQFLTKSDDFQSKRYVFVSDKTYQQDPQKWEVLNLSAIPYNTAEQHKQLWVVVSSWGDLINRKPSEHQIAIQKIVRKRGELTQQESDYIRCCLEQPSLAQCFFQHAKTERWLKWAYDNNILDIFFRIDFQPSEVEQSAIFWFSNNFIVKNYDLALKIIKEKGFGQLNPYLVDMIALAFHRAKKLPPRAVFSQWIHIILSSANFLPRNHISYILLKCQIPLDNDIALLLLNKITLPTGLKDRGSSDGTEYWIRDIWEKKFKPKISSVASEVEPLITHHLKLHELQERTRYNLHTATYISRPAIEENPHNFKHDLIDALIDIARDIIDYFTAKQSKIAAEVIERWYQQKTVILKRLSVYGITRHTGLSASEKLSWLLTKKELLHPTLTHENFGLIQTIYSHLDEEERQRLIAAAKREAKEDYPLYNFTVWLNRIDPDCPLAKAKLEELQRKNPVFGPRDDPDLSSHMSTRWGHISPISVEDLIKIDMTEAAKLLDTFKGEHGFDKPEREGLIDTLGNVVKENFDWSLKLAQELAAKNIWQKDIWHRILWSWSELKDLSVENANIVIKFILKNKVLHVHHYEVARFLSSHGNKLYESGENEKQSVKLAYTIRDIAFYDEGVDKIFVSDDVPDWWGEAINSTGHYICYFFVRIFDEKYKKTKQKRGKLDEFFLPFIENSSYSAQMGRVTLAHYLLFFFSVDKQWTRDTILPLFDWTIDTKNALQSWQAYLYRGRWSKGLFDDLIKLHQKTFTHFKGLGKLRDNYCQHVAGLTLYCVIFDKHDPLETGWLRAFIKHCEEEDLAAFAEGIYTFLRDNEEVQENSSKVWENLLLPYLDQRISGKPKTLSKSEFRWMLKWCLHLDSDFQACVEKIIEADESADLLGIDRTQHTDIFYRFKDSKVLRSNPEAAGRLILHLLSKKHISLWDWDRLKEVIQTITLRGCSRKTVSQIIEVSLSLGFTQAGQLKAKLEEFCKRHKFS